MRRWRVEVAVLGCLAMATLGVVGQEQPRLSRERADFFQSGREDRFYPPPLGRSDAPAAVDDGLAWLEANQNADGSWGDSLHITATGAVLETLTILDPCTSTVENGAAWLAGQMAANNDFLARQVGGLAEANGFFASAYRLALELLARRNPVEPDSALPNWPEGGWGLEEDFETDCQTTALALLGLERSAFNDGFTSTDSAVGSGTTNFHRWKIPFNALKARIKITVSGATVRLRMTQGRKPNQFDPYFELAPGGPYLIVFPDSGLDFTPGINYISIENPSASGPTATYSMTASYETPDFDTRTLLEPLDYLRQSQNGDGGWGLQRGQASDFYTTVHVQLALLAYSSYEFDSEVANGVAYTKSQQLGDGSFGIDGIPVSYMTALGALTLVRAETPSFSPETSDAITALLAQQDLDGSWAQEAYDTALAMLAIVEHDLPPTADAGGDHVVTDDGDCSEAVTLSGSGTDNGAIVSYSWTEDCVEIATGSSALVTLRAGAHRIVLTVTDDDELMGRDTTTVRVDGRDLDLDGLQECIGDCDDTNGDIWTTPGEVEGLMFTNDQTLSWSPPSELGGNSVVYDVLRNDDPSDFEAESICLETNDTDAVATDPSRPPAGTAFFYLTRAENDCPLGEGTLGFQSNRQERFGILCE